MLSPDKNAQLALQKITPVVNDSEPVGFGEKLGAAFSTENIIGAFLNNDLELSPYDPNYNPWEDMTEAERLDERFVDTALEANSPQDLESVRRQSAKEREARSKLTGVDGFVASMAAGLTDPVAFIPFGGAAYKTYRTGGSILKGAAITGSVAAGSIAAQEALLHSQQVERTLGESAVNITAGAFLASVLGGAVNSFSKAAYDKAVKDAEELLDLDKPLISGGVEYKSAGAAGVVKQDVEVKGDLARGLVNASRFDPYSRTITAKSQEARRLALELFESPVEMKGFDGTAVESLAKVRRDGLLYRGVTAVRQRYKDYLKDMGVSRVKGKFTDQAMSYREFSQAVSKEVRNPFHTNKHIKSAADDVVREVYEPQFKDMKDVRMLSDDVEVDTAYRYLNRVWKKDAIRNNHDLWIRRVSNWLMTERNLPQGEARSIANEIGQRISSSHDAMLPYDYQIGSGKTVSGGGGKAGMASPTKQRVFSIPDELVEEFLENDIETLMGKYLRQTSGDIEILRKFGDGSDTPQSVIDMDAPLKAVEEEYAGLIDAAKTPKEKADLNKEYKQVVSDIRDMTSRMRGTYFKGTGHDGIDRIFQTSRNWNFLRMMGGVVVSSIPDTGRIVMSEGMSRAFGSTFSQLSKGLRGVKNLPAEDVKYWGIGTDTLTGGRMEAIADVGDVALGKTKFERGLESLAGSFGNINLMNQWTGMMKVSHAVSMQSRFIDDAVKGKKIKGLDRLGLSQNDVKNILKEVKAHGSKDGGAWIFNAKNWSNQDLAERWAAALKKESDRVIIVPGQEKPLFFSSELGKTLMQFKSFMMSATQRVLISGVQGQDAHMLQGALTMIALGAMSYSFKNWEAGREVDLSPNTLIVEGIDRSGALGIFMEMNNTVEKLTGNRWGLRKIAGVDLPASRYASRNLSETVLGPTLGSTLDTTLRLGAALTDEGEWSESDTRAARRLAPFQNITGFRKAVDEVEKVVNNLIDAE